ncbi:exodeoxyribonuclease VII large subunit [Algoriphagus machipongonensis]|uniref:Exodeoxyribonuclease 7 large subunit n=1 Tax=Algoriphagus machipongonensis TaxID=388413 RepID=A3I2H4_9BACT|nr:exodeoxyribonuclease VII large subunit [Algoriphagus machipongonensis]EAZ79278.1 exodeoxyribonuclease VII, large subunit [Algoriphagus machipongonensis]
MHNARSISELNQLIQQVLDSELDPVYWVIGELSDFRLSPQGHAYFELVEKNGNKIQAKIRANLWQFTYRNVATRFESSTGTSLKNGMKVLAQVAINFHPLYGLSVNVKDIDPSFSLGERARVRQETIDRLTREGMLQLNSQLPIPGVIQKIGIISSATAAGYGDFINQIESNSGGYKIYHKLFPSLMQGNDAVKNLIQAIDSAEKSKDLLGLESIVIIRGGGAQLDLDCFDEYELAVKIAKCSLPVFTGIGHERDDTIADMVAHTKLKTPTAVAEFLLSGFREFEERLTLASRRMERATKLKIHEQSTIIQQFSQRLQSYSRNRLIQEHDKLNSWLLRINTSSKNMLELQQLKLENLEKGIRQNTTRILTKETEKLENKSHWLKQLDPKSILAKGYTRTEISGTPIHLTKAKVGDEMTTHTLAEKINSTITQIEEE